MSAGVLALVFVALLVFAYGGYRVGQRKGMRFFFDYRNDVAAKHGRLMREARSARFVVDVAWLGKGQDAPTPEQALAIEKATIRVKALDDAARTLGVEGHDNKQILAYCGLLAAERWGEYDRETGLWSREDGTMTTRKDCEGETPEC